MPAALKYPFEMMAVENQYGVFDDFTGDQTDLFWVDTITDSGSAVVGDAVRGIMTLTPSDGTVADNDEVYLATANEIFKLADNKPMWAVCYAKFTEANTTQANWAFGFQNAVSADSIIDDGGGLKVSGDCVAIYKVDGGTTWKCVSVVNGGTANVSTSSRTANSSSYQKLEIDVQPINSTTAVITYKVDNAYLTDSTTGLVIRHTVAYASSTEMNLFIGSKNGSAHNQVVLVDYIGGWQAR